jgi:hypothetical protein
MKLGEAVSRGIIANETLAYFIGRTWLLFGRLGVDLNRMRFRQHLQHEVRRAVEWSRAADAAAPRWALQHQENLNPHANAHHDPHPIPNLTPTPSSSPTPPDPHPIAGPAPQSTLSTHPPPNPRWRTTPRTAGTLRWRPPTAGSSARASQTAARTTCAPTPR